MANLGCIYFQIRLPININANDGEGGGQCIKVYPGV